MDANTVFANNARDFEKNMHEFIATEVQTSFTFAGIANTTTDEIRKRRDAAKARVAYDSALRFIAEAREKFPKHPIASSSLDGMEKLKQLLERLGERF